LIERGLVEVLAAVGVEQVIDPPELGLQLPWQSRLTLLRVSVRQRNDLDQMELVNDATLLFKELAPLNPTQKQRQLVGENLLEDLPLAPAVGVREDVDDVLEPLIY